jgi:alkylation response protein AidB-like acyl-CoA dehydrogenase
MGCARSNIAAIESVIDEALVAFAGEAIGAMEILTHDTVEYAKTRKQFGTAIGKFQALQFRMVDMWIAHQQSRPALYLAALGQSEGGSVAQRAASALKVKTTKASRFVGEQAVQIHGGIGTTDELRVGHYFKRLLCIEALLGSMDYHLDRYARLMHS